MRFAELRAEAQLDTQTLNRVRNQLVGERTCLINQIRSLLLERRHIVAQGRTKSAKRKTNSNLTHRLVAARFDAPGKGHDDGQRMLAAHFSRQSLQ